MAHAQQIKGKIGDRLRASLDHLPLSYQLATIRRDVELDIRTEDLEMRCADADKLRSIYKQLEFRSWLAALGKESSHAQSDQVEESVDYQTILSEKQFGEWLSSLKEAALISFDTETTSLDYMAARVVGVSFALTPGKAAYLPIAHNYPGAQKQLDADSVLARLKPLLEDPNVKKLGHNLKYDRNVLANHDINVTGIAHDTMLESYVMNSTANRHDLDTLCEKYLHHTNIHFEEVAGKGAKQVTFDKVELDKATPYAAEDADMALRLHHYFWPQIQLTECAVRTIPIHRDTPNRSVISYGAKWGTDRCQTAKRAEPGTGF